MTAQQKLWWGCVDILKPGSEAGGRGAGDGMTTPTRPALRYHGGKFLLAKWIVSHFPPHKVYIEPFGGAASVLMRKPRAYAEVYNDLDGQIVSLFRVLRDPAQARELERLLRLTPFARAEFELSYTPAADPIEQARRTILRSFAGFGSAAHNSDHPTGFRGDSNRSGTTPAHDWMHYPDALPDFVRRLQGVVIENRPALNVIEKYDGPRALIYCDPPYVHATRKPRQAANYVFEMTDTQHRELAEVLRAVAGYVVLSGYACPLYEELYPDWPAVTKDTHGNGNVGATARTEILWLSPRTWQALQAGAGLPLFQQVTP